VFSARVRGSSSDRLRKSGVAMTMGVSVVLIALGAVLRFAVTVSVELGTPLDATDHRY